MEKVLHANSNQKKTRVAILIWEKKGYKKQRVFYSDKGSIYHEDVIIINIYIPNNRIWAKTDRIQGRNSPPVRVG